jgi:hypothetical protein
VESKYGSSWGGGGSNEVNGSYGNGLWKILGVGHSFLVILDLK